MGMDIGNLWVTATGILGQWASLLQLEVDNVDDVFQILKVSGERL